MSIMPLPVFEADADPRHRSAMTDEEIYARLEPPKTIVVRFGRMKLVGEFPYDGDAKPGCGSKLVSRTHRGTEITEMLTSTCPNSGCSKSVSRQEMLAYIENSGGKDFPFHTDGRILRVATIDDLNRQSELQGQKKTEQVKYCKAQIAELELDMKLVDVEPILGEELLTFYFLAEERVDFRELVRRLASEFKTRIEMRQVGARDEARLVADYERCGQYCCCKNFLKLLKPVSMRLAKEQKATLDPLKISGRCGRLMCCLRYEDATYAELKANLPKRGKRVGTSEGPGVVVETRILVQLALVRLEHNNEEIAVPVEELMSPDDCPKPGAPKPRYAEFDESDPMRGMSPEKVTERIAPEPEEADEKPSEGKPRRKRRGRRRKRTTDQQQDSFRQRSQQVDERGPGDSTSAEEPSQAQSSGQQPRKRSRRRGRGRRHRRGGGSGPPTASEGGQG